MVEIFVFVCAVDVTVSEKEFGKVYGEIEFNWILITEFELDCWLQKSISRKLHKLKDPITDTLKIDADIIL